jgi:hypothetical protein
MDPRYRNCIRWLGGSELHITDGKASGKGRAGRLFGA